MKELTNEEMLRIDGGKNVVEYLAMGIGYVIGSFQNAYQKGPGNDAYYP